MMFAVFSLPVSAVEDQKSETGLAIETVDQIARETTRRVLDAMGKYKGNAMLLEGCDTVVEWQWANAESNGISMQLRMKPEDLFFGGAVRSPSTPNSQARAMVVCPSRLNTMMCKRCTTRAAWSVIAVHCQGFHRCAVWWFPRTNPGFLLPAKYTGASYHFAMKITVFGSENIFFTRQRAKGIIKIPLFQRLGISVGGQGGVSDQGSLDNDPEQFS